MEQEKEVWERLTAVEASTRSAHKRLDVIDNLAKSIYSLASETKAMREDLNAVRADVDDLKQKPSKRYETVVTAILSAAVSGTVGYLLAMILH